MCYLQDSIDALNRTQMRGIEGQLYNKVNELQEDLSMKKFDLRAKQIHLAAIRAQVSFRPLYRIAKLDLAKTTTRALSLPCCHKVCSFLWQLFLSSCGTCWMCSELLQLTKSSMKWAYHSLGRETKVSSLNYISFHLSCQTVAHKSVRVHASEYTCTEPTQTHAQVVCRSNSCLLGFVIQFSSGTQCACSTHSSIMLPECCGSTTPEGRNVLRSFSIAIEELASGGQSVFCVQE